MQHRDHNVHPGLRTEQRARRRQLIGNPIAVVVLLCLLCLIFFLFSRSYQSLQAAILQERVDYVKEISSQLITSQLFMEREYTEAALNLGHIVEQADIATFGDVRQYIFYKNAADVMLISEDNDIIDLNGRHISMPNDDLTRALLGHDGVANLFTSLNFAEDSWLFAAPIKHKEIDGTVFKAVVLAISADEFRNNMAISLFDDLGASYIVANDGRIKIKPLDDNLAFNGFNLFTSMTSHGAAEADVEQIKTNLQQGKTGSMVLKADGLDWLIGHTPVDGDTSIVVAIPLTLTAAKTYEGLSDTIILSGLSVVVIALIAFLFVLRFFYRDRIRAKEALAVAAKSEFFSKMSHDIRTPLNAVIGLVQLARDDTEKPSVRFYLSQSLASANYLLSIINDVLEVSRIESGKVDINTAPFDMRTLLNDVKAVTEPMLAEKQQVFTLEAPADFELEYIGDQVRIKQILANLLSNATKFTKPGGRIGLRVTSVSRPDGYDVVAMAVSDDGIGMSDQFLGRIFTPFEQERSSYTQQYTGSGLGLSIVNELARLMGGTVDVVSELGQGSTFTVSLPLLRGKKVVREEKPPQDEAASFSNKRVLLAEDNEINQLVAARLLANKFAITVETAADGKIALAMFADSDPGSYDLILMDVKMPVMDGLEATRAIRALPRPDAQTVPIIALSANAYKEDIDLSLAAGMNEHLAKPIDMPTLTAVFNRYFGQ